jgi:hypothetical protein
MRLPKENKFVTPRPFFNIVFGCSNRAFYEVKSDLYGVADEIGIEIEDGYITEECDYEGDLERITIYRGERNEKLAQAVLKFYNIDLSIPDDVNIVLSIH